VCLAVLAALWCALCCAYSNVLCAVLAVLWCALYNACCNVMCAVLCLLVCGVCALCVVVYDGLAIPTGAMVMLCGDM
jgi:hypothetical protein